MENAKKGSEEHEIKPLQNIGMGRQKGTAYWESRRHMLYYKSIFQFVSVIGYNANSIIDVGSAGTVYINWFSWIPARYQLDFKIVTKLPNVTAIETNFLDYQPKTQFDVALCLQVLEHVEQVEEFCAKLKKLAKRLLISVPYKWLGNAPGHIHDPVNEQKLMKWMGIKPNNQQIIYEPFREARLLAYYDLEKGPLERFDNKFIVDAIAHRELESGF